jgi:hypothetical protein
MSHALYDRSFFAGQAIGSLRSAHHVVPLVLSLVRPASVVDVGCGLGTWLKVFQDKGIQDIVGIDGDYVDLSLSLLSPQQFVSMDLTRPTSLDRNFDLAVSLEVAEHLPPECAEIFVRFLCSLAPAILFSAAIPFQGGTGHINEQWPEYWALKFYDFGYQVLDPIRPKIWWNHEVEWWYCQNTLLFVTLDLIKSSPDLALARFQTKPNRLAMVHPRRFLLGIHPAPDVQGTVRK